eukprot:TRINITY_DN4337_c0_g1_i6.p1 TRINITY_DN4337_c0_g1~~TRINITY_DN4337_c0_g1_i6.p1  ORF type:complete len:173 (-),score=36.54 TRINITY_DN4337_c0_g1_i6:42-560(-)
MKIIVGNINLNSKIPIRIFIVKKHSAKIPLALCTPYNNRKECLSVNSHNHKTADNFNPSNASTKKSCRSVSKHLKELNSKGRNGGLMNTYFGQGFASAKSVYPKWMVKSVKKELNAKEQGLSLISAKANSKNPFKPVTLKIPRGEKHKHLYVLKCSKAVSYTHLTLPTICSV